MDQVILFFSSPFISELFRAFLQFLEHFNLHYISDLVRLIFWCALYRVSTVMENH